VTTERVGGPEQRRNTLDEGKPLALDDVLRDLLAVVRVELGFGSKRATWDGPPAMNRKIMFFAFGAK